METSNGCLKNFMKYQFDASVLQNNDANHILFLPKTSLIELSKWERVKYCSMLKSCVLKIINHNVFENFYIIFYHVDYDSFITSNINHVSVSINSTFWDTDTSRETMILAYCWSEILWCRDPWVQHYSWCKRFLENVRHRLEDKINLQKIYKSKISIDLFWTLLFMQ